MQWLVHLRDGEVAFVGCEPAGFDSKASVLGRKVYEPVGSTPIPEAGLALEERPYEGMEATLASWTQQDWV